ncbi:MAG: FAD-binding oxidoreductase [Bacillota bacterium]
MPDFLETLLQEKKIDERRCSELAKQLRLIVGDDGVSAGGVDRLASCRDYWPMGNLWFLEGKVPALPDLVVWPRHTGEVAAVLGLANEQGIPVTPFGEGSGALGGAVPLRGGIILDLKRMNRVRELDRENLMVTVESGLNGARYEEHLNRERFTGGHIPQSIRCSTVGGWLACRAAGQFSTRYGKIEDMVVSLEAVLPDGTVFSGRPVPRSSTGPRVDHLFLGSEGTLGVITGAVLRVWPLPESRIPAAYAFETLEQALESVRLIIRTGARPAVVRLYDYAETGYHFPETAEAESRCILVLIMEGHAALAAAEAQIAAETALAHGAVDAGTAPVEHWLERRFNVSLASKLYRQGAVVDTLEVTANWSNAASLYRAMQEAMLRVEGTALASGHYSHVYPEGAALYMTLCGFPPGAAIDYYKRIWGAAMEACLKEGGAISHHHGIGLHRSLWLEPELGAGLAVLKRIKQALDPHQVMNPGKLGLEEAEKWRL